jgi:hypothetical protein
MKNIPDLVSTDNTDEIHELSKSIVLRNIVNPVRNALDMFEKNISRLIFLPDIPHVEFRLQTVQMIFDAMSEELKGGQYRQFLRRIGESVGKTLGESIMGFLVKNNKLPKTDDVLTKLWNEWDMVAGWGKISSVHKEDEIIITYEDGFLTRGRELDKHRHCPFLEGYIMGFLWVTIKERYRWFKRTITEPTHPPMEPVEVMEKPAGDKCHFIVRLREEELPLAFDALSEARRHFRLGDYDQCAHDLRISMELAFKEKIGIGKDDKTSVLRIMKSFRGKKVTLKYKTLDRIYNSTSRVIHGSKKSGRADCEEIVNAWRLILEDLELMRLSDHEREELKKKSVRS